MKLLRTPVVAVVIVFALLAAGAALFLILGPPAPRNVDLEATLTSIDSAIARGSLSTAGELLDGLRNLPATEADLLRLLKRAFAVGSASGDFGVLSRIGGKALSAAARSAPVRAIAALAYLRSGRVAEAEKIMGGGALPAETGALLRGEAILRKGGEWAGADALSRELISLERTKDPEAYAAAAQRTGDKRLSLDAALLAMESGRLDKARSIARSELDDAAFDEPAGAIAYDAGDFGTAIEKLARLDAARPGRAEIGYFLADSYQALGKNEQAEASLLRALQLAPSFSWTPYANLALFAAGRGDAALAGRRLDDGLAFFPASRELRVARARLAAQSGDTANASSILSPLVAEHPDDGEAALLLLDLQAAGLSPEEYRARLWRTFNRIPADLPTFAALSAALIGAHDWEGASVAIRQHVAASGAADEQLLLVEGMVSAMRGDDEGAADAFRRAAAIAGDGVGRFNLALVLLRRGNAKAAVAELSVASEEYARKGNLDERSQVLSRMQTLIGSARLLEGDEGGAREAFTRSLELNPRNLRAGLLLRKLEAGRQQ